MQMVGIREHDLRADRADVVERHAFDGRARADRHERRRLDDAVRERQTTAARGAFGGDDLESKSS